MPRARYDFPYQCAFSQRPAFMGAGVVDGAEGAGDVEESDALAFDFHSLACPWQYVLRFCDFHQLGHVNTSFLSVSDLSPEPEAPPYPPTRRCTGTIRSDTAIRCASWSGPLHGKSRLPRPCPDLIQCGEPSTDHPASA